MFQVVSTVVRSVWYITNNILYLHAPRPRPQSKQNTIVRNDSLQWSHVIKTKPRQPDTSPMRKQRQKEKERLFTKRKTFVTPRPTRKVQFNHIQQARRISYGNYSRHSIHTSPESNTVTRRDPFPFDQPTHKLETVPFNQMPTCKNTNQRHMW
jgi:hypothetical protein